MQKFLSYLIVFIISVFPIINASASLSLMEHIVDVSMSHTMSVEAMAVMDHSKMSSMHDCCETHEVICDHATACDCDNTQVNYSAVPSIQVITPQYFGGLKSRYISSLFYSKISDSLYRPPINIL